MRSDVALRTAGEEVHAKFSSQNILEYQSQVLGKVLTIVDASVTDRDQREAMKQLIKQAVWDTADTVVEWMAAQTGGKGSSFPY